MSAVVNNLLNKRGKFDIISLFMVGVNHESIKQKLDLRTNLEDLYDKSDKSTIRVRKYELNKNKVLKLLVSKNEDQDYVVDRRNKNQTTGRFESINIKVPTSLLLVVVKDFLSWDENKTVDCSGEKDAVSLITHEVVTDRNDVQTEIRCRFFHKAKKLTCFMHVYLTRNKIQLQGGGKISGASMAEWIWYALIERILIRAKVDKRSEIEEWKKEVKEMTISPKKAKA